MDDPTTKPTNPFPWRAIPRRWRRWKPLAAVCALALLLSGCLGTSLATTACDWHQTRSHVGDYERTYERNPILGDTPPAHKIDLYFMAVAGLLVAVHFTVPEKYRAYLHTAVTAVEAHVSWMATRTTTPGFCGWR